MREFIAVAVAIAIVVTASPVTAQEDPTAIFSSIEIVPADGTVLEWRGHRYAGSLAVRGASDGLVLTELVEP